MFPFVSFYSSPNRQTAAHIKRQPPLRLQSRQTMLASEENKRSLSFQLEKNILLKKRQAKHLEFHKIKVMWF